MIKYLEDNDSANDTMKAVAKKMLSFHGVTLKVLNFIYTEDSFDFFLGIWLAVVVALQVLHYQ